MLYHMEGNFGGWEMLANDHWFAKFIPAKFYPVKRKSYVIKFICAIILEYVIVDFKVLQLYTRDCTRPKIAWAYQ